MDVDGKYRAFWIKIMHIPSSSIWLQALEKAIVLDENLMALEQEFWLARKKQKSLKLNSNPSVLSLFYLLQHLETYFYPKEIGSWAGYKVLQAQEKGFFSHIMLQRNMVQTRVHLYSLQAFGHM